MPPVILSKSARADDGSSLLDNVIAGDNAISSANTKTLVTRATSNPSVGGQGTVNPNNINMQGMLALFAILGATFVLASIWFFFWAKNGGCVWRKGDWDEYKSTVLRRKGPDGRTLSNATTSTNLGGGTVRGYDDDDGLTYTDMTEETATTITNEKESVATSDRKRRKRNLKETAKEKLLRRAKDEKWEGEGDDDVRAYRQEKPARVGGINREAEGTYYGTEYTPTSPPTAYTESEVYQSPPEHRRRDTRNISGFSFTAGSEDVLSQVTEEHLIRDPGQSRRETRRHRRHDHEREERRSRHNSPRKQPTTNRSSIPGGYTEPLDFSSRGTNSEYQYSNVDTEDDLGTRSYHHPIPGLSKGYRRDRDGGGRRRRDSLSDSE